MPVWDLVYSYSTISSHREHTKAYVSRKACCYEDFSHKLLSKTEYSLPRWSQDKFLIRFEFRACNEQERMISVYLGNEKSRMTFEAGKRWESTMWKCTGLAMNQMTLKCTDVSLTSISQACSYGGEKQTQTHYMALEALLLFSKFHRQPRKKTKKRGK